MKPTGLLVDLQDAHGGVAITQDAPHFSWIVPSGTSWHTQIAFQVIISESNGVAVFDSGRVSESSSVAVALKDFKPKANQEYSFIVRCWNDTGKASDWSEPGKFRSTPSRTARFYISPQDRLVSRV
jgi:hypothetical protein